MATDTEPVDQVIRLFAEESRVRAFAAVALGAGTPAAVARTAGLSARETAVALHRLGEQGVVVEGTDGALGVAYDLFRDHAREAARRERTAVGPVAGEPVLRTFVRDGRLVRLPAQWNRKKLVLRHIAEQTFEPGVAYPERVVDEKLRAWCEESDEIDHVTLRRYLVDLHHLRRSEGIYRMPSADEASGESSHG
ncbi:DUF2087 domain-containing protein [Streptomyces griseorubiginosus]|uniref:DUF2087 domain-containing protein n=1 Tax=Streptomyces griseorubiginosus TaxID=67304 RepID=A0A124GZ31_9ACTN|nr:DUF2087 domain-containing protein [Streptomyces griseorubiginosus]KUM72635.1 hypothetical protein AQI84_25600 [Streptomyces griseorubiginosus]KUN69451.1 hypothetical protein AQJ54_07290 [Streptomyces griseorubiginosus]